MVKYNQHMHSRNYTATFLCLSNARTHIFIGFCNCYSEVWGLTEGFFYLPLRSSWLDPVVLGFVLLNLNNFSTFYKGVTRQMPHMEHELIALPEGVFTPVFLFVFSTFSFLFGRSLFVSLSFAVKYTLRWPQPCIANQQKETNTKNII
jgi:hypothetical protein